MSSKHNSPLYEKELCIAKTACFPYHFNSRTGMCMALVFKGTLRKQSHKIERQIQEIRRKSCHVFSPRLSLFYSSDNLGDQGD